MRIDKADRSDGVFSAVFDQIPDGGQGGVPVVFVHGLGSEWSVWREQLDHFRKTRRASWPAPRMAITMWQRFAKS